MSKPLRMADAVLALLGKPLRVSDEMVHRAYDIVTGGNVDIPCGLPGMRAALEAALGVAGQAKNKDVAGEKEPPDAPPEDRPCGKCGVVWRRHWEVADRCHFVEASSAPATDERAKLAFCPECRHSESFFNGRCAAGKCFRCGSTLFVWPCGCKNDFHIDFFAGGDNEDVAVPAPEDYCAYVYTAEDEHWTNGLICRVRRADHRSPGDGMRPEAHHAFVEPPAQENPGE